MTYYINYMDKKGSYKGLETSADSLEELVNTLLYKRDIASVEEIVELPDTVSNDSEITDDDFEDWLAKNRI